MSRFAAYADDGGSYLPVNFEDFKKKKAALHSTVDVSNAQKNYLYHMGGQILSNIHDQSTTCRDEVLRRIDRILVPVCSQSCAKFH